MANSRAAEVSALGYNTSDGKLEDFRDRRSTICVEEDSPVCQAMAGKYFRKKRKLAIAAGLADLLDLRGVKKSAPFRAGKEPRQVVAVGDTIIGEQGLVAIIGRDPRYQVCVCRTYF